MRRRRWPRTRARCFRTRQDAAGTAKRKIDEASDAGIQNRKWWEEIGDWVSDNWDTIVEVCKRRTIDEGFRDYYW